MTNSTAKPHALLIPYPLQGHVIPTIRLALNLGSKGITITFVNTESIHHQTSSAHNLSKEHCDIFSEARSSSGLDIHYEVINDGLPVDFDRSVHHDEFMGSLLHNMSQHVEVLARKLMARTAGN